MISETVKRYKMKSIANQEGVAIVTVLLLLMLLILVGVTATKTVINEKRIVRSEAVFEQSFFFAEAGALEGVQKLENETKPEELLAPLIEATSNNEGLLVAANEEEPKDDEINLDKDADGDFDKDDVALAQVSDTNPETKRVVVQMPIPPGSSLGLGSSRLYEYMSYGMTEANGGDSMIKIGYRKRF